MTLADIPRQGGRGYFPIYRLLQNKEIKLCDICGPLAGADCKYFIFNNHIVFCRVVDPDQELFAT
jgi:hypothetical protein